MDWNRVIADYVSAQKEEAYELLLTLARIPSPSNREQKRAEFLQERLIKAGAKGVYTDDALNVVYPIGCEGEKPIVVFMAHTDVVFPDETELPLKVENGRIYAPGIGDDTANVAALVTAAKFLAQRFPEGSENGPGILIVFNSGEEGLGNLKGVRKICAAYGKRIQELISFDGTMNGIVAKAVGSKRYEVETLTEGGHSYGSFGNRNAIACLAGLIGTLYQLKVPENGKTTYNVGLIAGGTSVNTIAQQATMLYEFRSDDRGDLEFMERHFNAVIEAYRAKGITVNCRLIGERPCMGEVAEDAQQALVMRAQNIIKKYTGTEADVHPGSTDCNIPLSLGIPAVSFGGYIGEKAHTREEWVEISSLETGLKVVIGTVLSEAGIA